MFFFFFFSSRRRHTRYWRHWSSDVCSSDLFSDRPGNQHSVDGDDSGGQVAGPVAEGPKVCAHGTSAAGDARTDRKRVVYVKSVDLRGRRIIIKKKKKERKKEKSEK